APPAAGPATPGPALPGPAAPGPALPGPALPDAPAPAVPTPAGPPPGAGPAAAGTIVTPRVGDWVRFEVRATGVDATTSLRWTAVAVEAARVRLRVESGTLGPAGAVLSARTTEVWVPLPTLPDAPGTPEPVRVGTRTVAARPVTRGEFTAWYAAEVPLGGLVRSRGPGGVEQAAVDFGRGS
ncbi:MAG: hypothetical protein JNM10_18220, partial [Planctomycetia bacterium]|nr:hypothetical protein [Planctomycetia bacterium]